MGFYFNNNEKHNTKFKIHIHIYKYTNSKEAYTNTNIQIPKKQIFRKNKTNATNENQTNFLVQIHKFNFFDFLDTRTNIF